MIVTHDVGVAIRHKSIIEGVNFVAKPSELVSIAGPNGSGKTTFLRALTGEMAYSGDIMFDGNNMVSMPDWKLATRRAVLPQSTSLSFPFTVLEVVRLGLRNGMDGSHPELLSLALAKVGLKGFEPRFYQELSGGEKQRVQLARVLVQVWHPVVAGDAQWLFLDEPVSALDIGHQIEVMSIAREFANAGGGVIAVMHDLNLAAMYSDSIALFEKGRLLIQDSPPVVMTNENLTRAYQWPIQVNQLPTAPMSFVLPQASAK
ncbi:heme ABC transporter ATP-binding protein [Rhodanobacter aciditrophus]|uniref:Heme ABC transporter ATP-binding protein n=1 Tax=Rhodanobacter aciditrophus TaxID=1623218 RepID=A0ABW4B2F5_9GAMM